MDVYNPAEYWQKRGRRYRHGETENELYNLEQCIHKHLPDNKKLLETGSGNGRIYCFLRKRGFDFTDRFVMCDFVDSFRNVCQNNTGILPDKWDGKKLPYNNNEFNFIILHSVLLHILPSEIDEFIKENVRVAEKYLFIATWYREDDVKQSGDYCFIHDYSLLFRRYDLQIIEDMKCTATERANWLLELM